MGRIGTGVITGTRPIAARPPAGWALAAALLAAGCGGQSEHASSPGSGVPDTLPSAPEPAVAPPVDVPAVGRMVPVGPSPEGLVFDPVTGLVVVGVRSPDGLVLLDREGQEVQRVGLDGAPRHLALAGPGGPVLVPAEGSDQLVQVTLPEGRVDSVTPVGRNPHDAVAVRGRIFVANEFADSVSVIEDAQVVEEVPAPVQPGGMGSANGAVAVVGVRARETKVFDATSLDELATPVTGAGPTHVIGHQDRLYVADTNGDAIIVVATDPEVEEVARVPAAGNPYGMAVDPERQRLWVTFTATNEVASFDISGPTPEPVTTLATVRQPNSVAVDAETGTVYVAGAADGRLQIIPPDLAG